MTALADLRADFEAEDARWRAGEPRKPHAIAAYNRYVKEACRQGQRPDALDRTIADETARFFSRVLQGADGHAYWDSADKKGFKRNDGTWRKARLWWWEKEHGALAVRGSVKPTCGDIACIAANHQRFVPWSEIKRLYSDARIVGALQVAAQRLGKVPTAEEFRALKLGPSPDIAAIRFGSWRKALAAAGLAK